MTGYSTLSAPRPRLLCWIMAAVAILSTTQPAFSLDRDRTLNQFQHRSWTAVDGAPAGIITMSQTVDGFLWLGTSAGLYRFDGIRFENYEPHEGALLAQDVRALLSTPEGGLWVGYATGGASYLLNDKVVNYAEPEGLPGTPYTTFK